MDYQGITKNRLSFYCGLALALLFAFLNCIPALAAEAPKWDGSKYALAGVSPDSQIVTRPLLSFSPPDVTFTYGINTNNYSLIISNLGDGTAADVYLYVNFGAINVTTSSAPYTSGSTPYFKLPDIPAAGSYTLTFTLEYSNWCTGSALERTLIWQPNYRDTRGNDFTSGVEISSVQPVTGKPSLQASVSGAPDVVQGDSQVTYRITSAYSGASSCGNGPMGTVAIVDTVPANFIVVDAGGGTWIPGTGGTGGTITWGYTQPAKLDQTITLQATSSAPCGAPFTNSVTSTCTDCAGAVSPATASQTSSLACGNQAAAQKTATPVVCERCGQYQYTNTYHFNGDVGQTLNSLVFTDLAENQQQYISASLSAVLDGTDITSCANFNDATPGGSWGLGFSGCPAYSLNNRVLVITYRLGVTSATAPACESFSFYSRSELTLPGSTIYSAVPVQVQAPVMALSISGLDPGIDKGESKTVSITITSTSTVANPRDARFVLSGENYYVINPAAVSCSGDVAPTSCAPTIIGNDYVWYFNDSFNGSGKTATFQLNVQKRITGGTNLDGRIYYDDRCNDDGTSDNTCSTAASATPALLRSGDLAIEVSPSINPTAGKSVQWKTYVINRGSGTAYNVWADHVLGAGLEYVSSTVDDPAGVTTTTNQDHAGGALNGAATFITSMAPGERREITLNATRFSQSGLTYTATTSWGVLGSDGQTANSSSSTVSIQPLIVTNANDSGPGSLRQAIADAVVADTILFDDNYTIYLTSPLTVSKELTIYGNNHSITLSGDSDGNGSGDVRVFHINNSSGTVTLKQLSIVNGSAPGGNPGGGIYNQGTLSVQNSTFSGNSAQNGGGIDNPGTLTVQNSTFSGNSALDTGGGISNNGTLTVQNSTFSENSALNGGGIVNNSTLNLYNTIIANSATGSDCVNTSGTVTADHNLIEASEAGACGITGGVAGNIVGQDPLLGALGAYGGKTQTFALLPGSQALDSGQNCLTTDQRGVSRPQPAGGACDIGAHELRQNHTVTFDANLGSGTMSPQTINSSTALSLNTFTRNGYTFSGWNTAANGSGTAYADGATYDFTADVTLYARWTALPNHTVTFDANLGSGTMSAQTTHVTTALSLNAFTRNGYTFSGWNTAANGSGTAYADGATYDFTADVTLYAQWTAIPPAAFGKSGPTGAAIDVSTEPTLTWTASSDQTGYEYCYDTASSGPCTGTWTSTGDTTSAKLTGLDYSTTYRWQVRAVNDSFYTYADGGTLWTFTTNVKPLSTTITTLTVTEHSFSYGQTWTLTARVTASAGTPTATVTFRDGATVLGTSDLKDGVATLDVPRFTAGPHSITAEYQGAGGFTGSISEAVNVSARQYLTLPLILR